MKTILLWDARFPHRTPTRLTVHDDVASAAVRAGVAAAANPAEAGALATGSALSPSLPTEVVLQHGTNSDRMTRVILPYSVVLVGAGLGLLSSIGTPIAGTPATPTVTLSAAVSKAEGNSGANLYTYTVTRSATSGATSVPWTFTANSTSAADFTGGTYPAGGSVALADGVATGTFSVSVNGDIDVEADESFGVAIAAPSGYAAGASMSTTGTILNDDASSGSDLLIVVSGQSNALGYGLTSADVPTNLQTADSNIKIWTTASGGSFATLVNGTNNDLRGSQNWGPEAEFARRWRLANPSGTVWIVKDAIGGTRLAADTGSDWSPTSTGEYFANLETRVTNAKAALSAAGKTTVVSAFLWHQGESDAQTLAYANAYQQNLTDLAAAVRSRIGDSATKFIVGKINRYSGWTYRETVRAAQEAVGALTGNAIVDCDSYALQTDYAHFAASGQQAMGADMYAAYMGTYTRPALWTPANDASVFGWWDVFDPARVTLANGYISSLADRSAGGHPAAQATVANQPLYSVDGAGHLPSADLDGTDALSTANFAQAQPFAVFDAAVFRTAADQYPALFLGRGSGTYASEATLWEVRPDAANPSIFAGGSTVYQAGAALADGQPYVLGGVFNGSSSSIRLNGTATATASVQGNGLNGVSIGAYLSANRSKSRFRERVLTTDLTAATSQKIEGYLAHKWSQPDKLPVGHPYRFQAPLP